MRGLHGLASGGVTPIAAFLAKERHPGKWTPGAALGWRPTGDSWGAGRVHKFGTARHGPVLQSLLLRQISPAVFKAGWDRRMLTPLGALRGHDGNRAKKEKVEASSWLE